MSSALPATADLASLAALFYPTLADLGHFERVESDALPADARTLLAHEEHMTVTVEAFHRSPVDVSVLAKNVTERHYARKIVLRRRDDGRTVQFGIVRLRLDLVEPDVRREIEAEQIPLGRILIAHHVMRQVELVALWKIVPGGELRELLSMGPDTPTFGRTALIHCDGEPAIELLEIIAPPVE